MKPNEKHFDIDGVISFYHVEMDIDTLTDKIIEFVESIGGVICYISHEMTDEEVYGED